MKWTKKDIEGGRVRQLSDKTGMNLLQASILVRRGFNLEESRFFLEDDFRYLHNPFLFRHMSDAIDRIQMAAEEKEHVIICGDRDVDGITSTILLIEALADAGINAEWKVPTGEEAYGLNPDVIRDFASRDGTLIFCVDCGISDFKEVALAGELGIDVIILDHHNPRAEKLPDALCIINPKVQDDSYPFEGLAGCAVVSKLIWALCFSRTELYGHEYCFFYINKEKNQLEIYKYINLVETSRKVYSLSEEIPLEELAESLKGWPLFSYDLPSQQDLLDQVFGKSAELHISDIADEICLDFPGLKGMDFQTLRDKSRLARYGDKAPDNGEAFLHLFSGLMLKRYTGAFEPFEKALDLVALGTLADLMPLVDENRILVKRGMTLLGKAVRPGLRELFIRQRLLGKPLETNDVSWMVSPWINSSGRMGQADKAVELFITQDEAVRTSLADALHDLNQERKKLGDSLWDSALEEARGSQESLHNKLIMVRSLQIPRGITGILAAKMVNTFSVPSLILSRQEDGSLSGSIRSPRGCSIQPLLHAHADLFVDFGGHDCAAGFSMEGSKEELFVRKLGEFCRTWKPEIAEDIPDVDAEIPGEYLNPELWEMVGRLGPYGEGFRPLLFFSRNLLIEKSELIGKEPQNHLKFLLSSESSKFPALYWNGAENFKEYMSPDNRVNLLYHVSRNYYMNRESLQITVIDMEPAN
ncbi:single-stranded-DNA-specific exonuclease RecJ [Oceanispirochaeta sp.]|jgi:single-stranded-DNA-specific exonuclease|uniref:single-stranded-DNA-specific exonuclease RecJ n=1 Tax=Oceanispirochaeta sp. TaxID=2035350 RepID=UPI002613F9F9|nr:single-stranded-DNA-specific exonuclease RecJ [Oceanispirochaeta sp.]MDA3956098.1 single-stranded-DNA-specific exonuclease RecJ [Oceanispirochaeta sp.]